MELGNQWYVREEKWKLNRANELFDMRNSPFEEILIPADSKDESAMSARKRLSDILAKINPQGGILDDADGSGRHKSNVDKKNAQKKSTGL
jgi:hypothetical protein